MNVQVLSQLLKYEFSRKLKPDDAVELPEIHGFCDAGVKAHGSVLFLRWKLAKGTYTCTPILVKAFVSIKEEVDTSSRTHGMPLTRKSLQDMRRSIRIRRNQQLQKNVLDIFPD